MLRLGVNGVAATNENVALGKYPIGASERLYALGKPQGVVRDFVDDLKTDTARASVASKSRLLAIAARIPGKHLGM